MTKQAKYVSIAAFVTGLTIGVVLGAWQREEPCPEVDLREINRLGDESREYHLLYLQAQSAADRYAAQRDSAYNNPIIVIRYKNKRDEITESLNSSDLDGVIDTLARPASENWRLIR